GRSKPASIHRFVSNRFQWLCRVTRFKAKKRISFAQLYRFLDTISWESLNELLYEHFEFQIEGSPEWNAVDGKALRGSPGQQIISFRGHESQLIQAQRRVSGPKSSEITEFRALLEEYDLWNRKITLEALHLNPLTTAGINQKGGSDLIQVKENQPELLRTMGETALLTQACGWEESVDKGHGRLEIRKASFFSLPPLGLDSRWKNSGIQGFMVVERITEKLKTGAISMETSFYLTNRNVAPFEEQKELFQAVRNHWGVESDHWIRDVTFQEDRVWASDPNRAQILGLLRTLALYLFRTKKVKNMRQTLESFADSPGLFKKFLTQVNFL
ncbi:MAG: ISAs1 family transposase, partial [Deltaproteobacteria bacterium]